MKNEHNNFIFCVIFCMNEKLSVFFHLRTNNINSHEEYKKSGSTHCRHTYIVRSTFQFIFNFLIGMKRSKKLWFGTVNHTNCLATHKFSYTHTNLKTYSCTLRGEDTTVCLLKTWLLTPSCCQGQQDGVDSLF
jgi:hypothetical protein